MLNINVAPLEDNMISVTKIHVLMRLISVTKIHVLMRFAHRIIRPQPASAVRALPVANTSLSATACCWLSDHSIVLTPTLRASSSHGANFGVLDRNAPLGASERIPRPQSDE